MMYSVSEEQPDQELLKYAAAGRHREGLFVKERNCDLNS